MPSSIASSGPLTSPAPSLSPPPELEPPSNGGLQSDSDLSELTDDDQEVNTRPTHPTNGDADDGEVDDEDVANDEDGDDDDDDNPATPARPKRSLVPDGMWVWAYKKNPKQSGSTTTNGASIHHAPTDDGDDDGEDEVDDDDDPEDEMRVTGHPKPTDDDEDEDVEADDASHDDDNASSEALSEQEGGDAPDDDDLPVGASPTLVLKREKVSVSPDLTEEEGPEEEEDEDPESQAEEGDDNDNDSEEDEDSVEAPPASTPLPLKEAAVVEALSVLAAQAVQAQEAVPAPISTLPLAAPPALSLPNPLATAGSSIMGRRKTPTPTPSPSPEPEMDGDGDDAGVSRDADADMGEVDGDADADIVDAEAEENEADLQPAHRAEALDILAAIELKFALVREKSYAEKMEDLAQEEQMIIDGCHPEGQHLQNELETRRERRLEVASRKRSFEAVNIERKYKYEQSTVWTWWMDARDTLQMEMLGETNRKRRKLERDRRTYERPLPYRRIPGPPNPREIPIVLPNMREMLDSAAARHNPATARHRARKLAIIATNRRGAPPPHLLVDPSGDRLHFPTLSTLAPVEVAEDLQMMLPRVHQHHQSSHRQHQHPAPPQQQQPVYEVSNHVHGQHGHPEVYNGHPPPVGDAPPNGVMMQDGLIPYPIPGRGRSGRQQQQQQHHQQPPPPQHMHPGDPYAVVNGNVPMRRSPSPVWSGGARVQNGMMNGWREDNIPPTEHRSNAGPSRRPGAGGPRDLIMGGLEDDARMMQRERDTMRQREMERERDNREREHRERSRNEYQMQQQQQQQQQQQHQLGGHRSSRGSHLHSHGHTHGHNQSAYSPHPMGPSQQQQQQPNVPHHHHVMHHHPHHHHHHQLSGNGAPPLPGPPTSSGSRLPSPRPDFDRPYIPSDYDGSRQRPNHVHTSSGLGIHTKRMPSPPLYYEADYRERERDRQHLGLGDAIAAGSSAHFLSNPPPPPQGLERSMPDRSRHSVHSGPSTFPTNGPGPGSSSSSSPRHHESRDPYLDDHLHRVGAPRSPAMGPGGALPPQHGHGHPYSQHGMHLGSSGRHSTMGGSPPGRQQHNSPPLSTFPGPSGMGSPSRLQTLPPTSGSGPSAHGPPQQQQQQQQQQGPGRTISPLIERSMHPHPSPRSQHSPLLSTLGPGVPHPPGPPPPPPHPSSSSMFTNSLHQHHSDGSPRMPPHPAKAQMVDGL